MSNSKFTIENIVLWHAMRSAPHAVPFTLDQIRLSAFQEETHKAYVVDLNDWQMVDGFSYDHILSKAAFDLHKILASFDIDGHNAASVIKRTLVVSGMDIAKVPVGSGFTDAVKLPTELQTKAYEYICGLIDQTDVISTMEGLQRTFNKTRVQYLFPAILPQDGFIARRGAEFRKAFALYRPRNAFVALWTKEEADKELLRIARQRRLEGDAFENFTTLTPDYTELNTGCRHAVEVKAMEMGESMLLLHHAYSCEAIKAGADCLLCSTDALQLPMPNGLGGYEYADDYADEVFVVTW